MREMWTRGEWWRAGAAPRLRAWWAGRASVVLGVAAVLMALGAAWRLGNEFPRLLWDAGGPGAFDLALRHREVHLWFAGAPIYNAVERGDYPPTSYVILWPALGWLTFGAARWLWALSTVAALGWLVHITVRASLAASRLERAVVALLPFSMYATSATIRGGQLANHVLPLLLAGILLILRRDGGWRTDLVACALLVSALVKPTLAIPFFWLVWFVPGRLRPIVLASVGYAALTVLAASFQHGPLSTVLFGWLAERPQALQGHANVHKWLRTFGLTAWMLPVSFAILVALGGWVARHRRADVWLLLGVTAVVAHFWIHHRLYDDVLILVPMIALFRIAKGGPAADGGDVMAAILFAMTWAAMLAPAGVLSAPAPLSTMAELSQTLVLLAVLAFLAAQVRRAPTLAPTAATAPMRQTHPLRSVHASATESR